MAVFSLDPSLDLVPKRHDYSAQTGLERGQRQRITVRPQAMLEARDLPTCDLSNYLEQRLAGALGAERAARAQALGLPPEAVPSCEGLTVRMINNVDKVLEVKQRFFDAFRPQGHADRFKFRQKVVVLYQRLDGVDVALYCLYVQEFGSDNLPPNKRVVYLSYLDSVKYFRWVFVKGCGLGLGEGGCSARGGTVGGACLAAQRVILTRKPLPPLRTTLAPDLTRNIHVAAPAAA